jgi:hypothetical protein
MKAAERKPLAPVTGTDQTCFEITGLQWRNVRPWLVEHGVPLVKVALPRNLWAYETRE